MKIAYIIGMSIDNDPFNYLGVTIFKGCAKRSHLQVIADKLKMKIEG